MKEYPVLEDSNYKRMGELTLRCKCGKVVTKGAIISYSGPKKSYSNHFHISEVFKSQNDGKSVLGAIVKQGSNNPKNWTSKCSECQANG